MQDIIELAEPLLEPSRVANGRRSEAPSVIKCSAHDSLGHGAADCLQLPIAGSSFPLRTSSSCFLTGQLANEPVRSSPVPSLHAVSLRGLL